MKMSKLFAPTLREIPAEAQVMSHILMLKAGYIRKLASGIYSYLPLGLMVIKKIENLAREVFDSYDAQELLMPALQPIELWDETGRSNAMGNNMFRLKDRNGRDFCLGMTHEESITDIVRTYLKSYKDLPTAFYQIQTKFRDEPRPRSGIIRGREFVMKDLYSFHRSWECLKNYYDKMYEAYTVFFKKCCIKTHPFIADSGAIGGDICHEFMCFSDAGEDFVFYCNNCGYSASEAAVKFIPQETVLSNEKELDIEEINTPNIKTIDELVKFLKTDNKNFVKTIIYKTTDDFIAVLSRGDRNINENSLIKALNISEIELATAEDIFKLTGSPVGFSGPVGLNNVRIIADEEVRHLKNIIVGANRKDHHLKNVNPQRDLKNIEYISLRSADENDLCHNCRSKLTVKKGIELGHIFQLGTKYSESMKADFMDEDGILKPFIMGCYGIGISRIAAAIIELNHDENGIIWPPQVAPYKAVIIPVLGSDNADQFDQAQKIYHQLLNEGIETVIDDRSGIRPGVKFKDADLIGFPVKIVIGKSLSDGKVELKLRCEKESKLIGIDKIIDTVKTNLKELIKKYEQQ